MKMIFTVRELAIAGLFTAITAILAPLSLPLSFTPAPISFGMVAVYITGIFLKPKLAVFSQLCYLMIGAAGLPVFGNFRSGIAALFGPTGGYLLVYPIMSAIVSLALNSCGNNSSKKRLFARAGISICTAHIILYLGGTAWLSMITGSSFGAALSLGVYPFIMLDIVKIIFCIAVIVPLRLRFGLKGIRN